MSGSLYIPSKAFKPKQQLNYLQVRSTCPRLTCSINFSSRSRFRPGSLYSRRRRAASWPGSESDTKSREADKYSCKSASDLSPPDPVVRRPQWAETPATDYRAVCRRSVVYRDRRPRSSNTNCAITSNYGWYRGGLCEFGPEGTRLGRVIEITAGRSMGLSGRFIYLLFRW